MAIPILVVDDSAMSRKLVIRALPPEWDVEVHQAGNGQEALDAYNNCKAQVMLLDLTMPVMDGFQVLESLQKEDQKPFIIVISADVQPKAQERVMELGAVAFLKKPIKTEELSRVLTDIGILS
jgi:two-component system, chemotaxis family, chemotaxis protein CheY